jgi:SAM-dependent methyltransferase
MEQLWDAVSALYLERQPRDLDEIVYGLLAPTERELGLLGDLRHLLVLDLGCGGGQTTIALARAGAKATGVDSSRAQLRHARRLAAGETNVDYVHADITRLDGFADESYDLAFSAYALPYVEDVQACLAEWWRVLRPGGRLVFSLDHPLRDCFRDLEDDDLMPYPVRSYFDRAAWQWEFPGSGVFLRSQRRTIGDWLDVVQDAGFGRVRMVEPLVPSDLMDEFWPEDSALASLRMIPHTLIVLAEKG